MMEAVMEALSPQVNPETQDPEVLYPNFHKP